MNKVGLFISTLVAAVGFALAMENHNTYGLIVGVVFALKSIDLIVNKGE